MNRSQSTICYVERLITKIAIFIEKKKTPKSAVPYTEIKTQKSHTTLIHHRLVYQLHHFSAGRVFNGDLARAGVWGMGAWNGLGGPGNGRIGGREVRSGPWRLGVVVGEKVHENRFEPGRNL